MIDLNEFDAANDPGEDPVITEVRAAREAYAAKFSYDLRAIFNDLQRRQATSGERYNVPPAGPAESPPAAPTKRAG